MSEFSASETARQLRGIIESRHSDHALEQLQQLSDLLQPYTQVGETIVETVQRILKGEK